MRVTQAKSGAVPLYRVSVTITDAQIKALDVATVTIPDTAPGVGRVALPIGGVATLRNASGAYTNLGPGPFDQTWYCGWPTPAAPFVFWQPNDPGIAGLGTPGSWVIPNGTGIPPPVPLAQLENQPLIIGAFYDFAGSLTGGNANNGATFIIDYRIVTL